MSFWETVTDATHFGGKTLGKAIQYTTENVFDWLSALHVLSRKLFPVQNRLHVRCRWKHFALTSNRQSASRCLVLFYRIAAVFANALIRCIYYLITKDRSTA